MTVEEFLARERAALEAELRAAGPAAPHRFGPASSSWTGSRKGDAHCKQLVDVLRDVVSTGKVRDRLALSPDYAGELQERWERAG